MGHNILKTAARGGVVKTYVDDVFSTYLYTGNSTSGGTQTITTNVGLSTYGGMVWIKGRSAASDNILTDTVRGAGTSATASKALSSDLTSAESLGGTSYDYLSAFSTTGFTVTQGGTTTATRGTNYNAVTYAAWTFRKQPKFFDVVTWTGNGTNRTIAHSLGQVPGCIIVKRTDTTADWQVYHRSLSNTEYLVLNTTAANATGTTRWNSTTATATDFSLGTDTTVNASGGTYVAYLFSHDTATDGLIQCGSFTGTFPTASLAVSLGYEPQWVLYKRTDTTGNWKIFDNMRGWSLGGYANSVNKSLAPNLSNAENDESFSNPTATGMTINNNDVGTGTYIYIAIRRPNKPPTSGTQVFAPVAYTGNATNTALSAGFPVDMLAILRRSNPFGDGDGNPRFMDRLRGGNSTSLLSNGISAEELSTNNTLYLDNSVGFNTTANNPGAPTGFYFNVSTNPYIAECFRRAPGFFDVVCYTGTGSNTTQTHNLGAIPELIIVKRRGTTGAWSIYSAGLSNTEYLVLNTIAGKATGTTYWNSTTPTASVFSLGTAADVNASTANNTYVAYLFATKAGISKVFAYTGNGSSQTINCGFAAGARFVLIKRTDSTGDWYVWDSARGIVAGNDPHLSLNSTAAEVTTDDSVDADSTGFIVNQVSATNINVTSATYIGLAIA